MTSDVEICNLALDAIGSRSTISSLQEPSTEARACARHYGQALRSCLAAAHWNFARKQAAMTLLKDSTKAVPDVVPTPWRFEYAYPSDCIQGRYIMPARPPVPFLISLDVDGSNNNVKVILTNQPSAILVYTVLITDTSLFDDQFVTAFYNYLGYRISIPLSGDKAMAKMAFQLAEQITNAAQASNASEGLTVIDDVPDWIRVRGYASDWACQDGASFLLPPQSLLMVA